MPIRTTYHIHLLPTITYLPIYLGIYLTTCLYYPHLHTVPPASQIARMKFSGALVFSFLVASTLAAPFSPNTTSTSTAPPMTTSKAAVNKYPSIKFTPTDSAPLVPLFNETGADPAVLKALKTIPFPRTLLSTLAHAQGLFVPLMGVLGSSFDGKTRQLPISDWLMIVCRVGIRLDAEYVFANNVYGLTIVGWDYPKIDSLNMSSADIVTGQGPWTHRERVLLRIVDEQLAARTNSLDTMAEAMTIFSTPEIIESLIMIGTYTTFAGVARGMRVAQDSFMPGLEQVIRRIITSGYTIVNQG